LLGVNPSYHLMFVRLKMMPRGLFLQLVPPRVDHLDVVGGLTPTMTWKPRIHSAPLTHEPGRAVALGRVLVLT
jgi:hypothetical protein